MHIHDFFIHCDYLFIIVKEWPLHESKLEVPTICEDYVQGMCPQIWPQCTSTSVSWTSHWPVAVIIINAIIPFGHVKTAIEHVPGGWFLFFVFINVCERLIRYPIRMVFIFLKHIPFKWGAKELLRFSQASNRLLQLPPSGCLKLWQKENGPTRASLWSIRFLDVHQ